ncbi:uncharacterized protein LOC108664932 [Hyalella azteca]|uniref:Uncharacterized protein LOC108664932 n=1 Tax=Hyalella azteca TaxID=294128 RepID=A0A8B7N0Q5_HYAAZ|nr:uncharacterized protein LOC108664932 [Hyalella azteca]
MFRVFIIAALVAAASAAGKCKDLKVTLGLPGSDANTTINYSVCPEANVITSQVVGNEYFQGATSYEDYDTGYGATRDAEKEECLVQKLTVSSLKEQAAELAKQSKQNVKTTGNVSLIKVPEDEPESEFGKRIANFCGNYPVYKVGTDNEETRVAPFEQENRQVTYTFTKCFILRCFFYYTCYTTTLTIPTGTTVTFFWFFG